VELTIKPASKREVVEMASRLRAADKREMRAVTGQRDMREILSNTFNASQHTFAVYADPHEPPVIVYGAAKDPGNDRMGVVWLVASTEITRVRKAFLKRASEIVVWLQRRYPMGLHNLVDSRNTLHIRWLKKLGFVFPAGKTAILNGVEFQYFIKR
jgi:hypothetical protein